jgi:glycosyltransferase involved in cell wall biosynthesis
MPDLEKHTTDARVCVVHQHDGTDVRIGKVCRTLAGRFEVTYLGWCRDDAPGSPDLGSASRMLFVRRSGYGPRAVVVRLLFLAWVIVRICRLRPNAVVAVNEELAAPLVLLKKALGFRLIADIHDPVADRVKSSRLRRILTFVERLARDGSDAICVTDEHRLTRLSPAHQAKATIIPNFPNRPTFDVTGHSRLATEDRVVIGVVGSLHGNRGLATLRRAMDKAGNCVVEIAGWMADDEAASFCQSHAATYHGILGMQDSLRLMSTCDLIFCFYDPRIPNNVNASPNKVYEAICLGRMSVINSEARISTWVLQNGFGYACKYDDVDGLVGILTLVHQRLDEHRTPNPRLIAYAEDRLYWEGYESRLIELVSRHA